MSITIEDLIESAQFRPSSVNFPGSWCGHLPFAYWIIKQKRPQIFVELGTHTGNSYFSFCQAVQSLNIDTKCFAVDTWLGDEHAGAYDASVFENIVDNNKHYSIFSNLLRMTFDEAVSYFSDDSIELLHIDGLHTYEAVKHDFQTWLPKLAKGAVVLFHDTNVRERNFGVWKLWEELKLSYPNHLDFLHSHGLGVLQLGTKLDYQKLNWLSKDNLESKHIKDLFSALGQKEYDRYNFEQLRKETKKLQQSINECEAKIVDLNQRNLEQQSEIIEKVNAVETYKLEVSNITDTLLTKDNLICSFENSTSWRITRPFRWIAHMVKVLFYVGPLIFPSIKKGGGIKRTAQLAWGLYKSQGIEGLKKGFRVVASLKLIKSGHINTKSGESPGLNNNNYLEWIRRYDTITQKQRIHLFAKQENFGLKPKISVIMPTFNSKSEWLIDSIESVRKQIYPNWELCIADDASTDPKVRLILEKYAKLDQRIKIAFRTENGHISVASNTALGLATGNWVALLDHDDVLSENAFFWIANAINQNPDAKLIYSDEDKISESGVRSDPYFKCDWNPDLFYSHNMICHLSVYRKDVIDAIGGFRVGFEGSQDYDLALRFIEIVDCTEILHVPRVLYHWRVHLGSTASSLDSKPYAIAAGERALNEHFIRTNVHGRVVSGKYGYEPKYELPNQLPLVSIIIPTRNGKIILEQCVNSIFDRTLYINYEIIIVDNGSNDNETLKYLSQLADNKNVRVLKDNGPFNYSYLNNIAARAAAGEILALVNNDIEVISPDWLNILVSHAIRPGIGAVGAKLWYTDKTLQHGGVITGLGGVAGHSHKHSPFESLGYARRLQLTQNLSAVTAACLVVKKSTFLEVDGLNQTDLPVAFNDVDFCLRLQEIGYRNVWTPLAELFHHESATRGQEDTPEKISRFIKEKNFMKDRWGDNLINDPAYSPNLTLDAEDFSLAWPPRYKLH